jgi:tripartite ATP-independent transporter DctP family solute receptor
MRSMNSTRILPWLCAAVVALASVAAAPGASTAGEVTLKLAHTQNAGTAIDKATRKMAERLAELTNGAIEMKLFGASSLGNERQQVEQVQLGGIDLGIFSNDYLSNITPEIGVVTLPYIIRDIYHIHKVWEAPVGKELTDLMLKKGLRSLGTYDYSFRNTLTQTHPIKNLNDFKNVKIRVMETPTVIKTWKLLGANPIPMPWSEVYSAMQTKVIDAMEAPPESMWSTKIQEVGKYLTMTQHQYTGSHIIMGEPAFQRLKPAFQQALLKAGLENAKYQQEIALEQNREFLKNLKDFGVQIFEINVADLQKVVAPVYDDFSKSVGGKDWAQRVLAVK